MIDLIPIARAAEEAAEQASSGSFIDALGINWKIFLAQLFNFGLVLFVLRRWAYKPLVKILNTRAKKIEKSLEEAKQIESQLKKTKEEHEAIISKARNESLEILDKTRREAEASKAQILQEAKASVDQQMKAAKAKLGDEKVKIIKEIKAELADTLVLNVEKNIFGKNKEEAEEKLNDKTIKEI